MLQTEAIVLRTTDYGETHVIVTLLTPARGKHSALASGAKKTRSRFRGAVQLFTHGYWLLFEGKGMWRAAQADVIESFRTIRADLQKMAYAVYMMELTDRFVTKDEPVPGVFEQVLSSLRQLEAGKDEEILARIFEMKMLGVAGCAPDLLHCAHCKKELRESTRFSIRLGGALCETCYPTDPQALVIHPSVLKLLRLFQQIDVARIGHISVRLEVKEQLEKVLFHYIDEYTGVTLKSRYFLEQMKRRPI